MQRLKTKLRQLVYFFKRDFLTAQNVIFSVGIVIIVWLLFGSIGAISKNWSLQTKLNTLKAEEELVRIEIETLKLEQQYYKTEEYQELMARKKLGKIAEGETMVILKENSTAAKEKYQDENEIEIVERSNFVQWLDLLF